MCPNVPEDLTWYLAGELANTIKTQIRKTKREDPCAHYNSPYPDPDWVTRHPEKNMIWNLDSFMQSANYWMVEDELLPGSILPHLLDALHTDPSLVARLSKDYRRSYLSAFMKKLTVNFPHMFYDTCIEYGFIAFLKYGYERMHLPFTNTTSISAVMVGNYKVLVYLHEHGCPWNESTCAYAALCNQLKCLQYAHENGCPWDDFTCKFAAERGNLNCLEYAHENGCKWNEGTCIEAARGGHLDCLKYAHENGCKWNESTCIEAARGGHLDCLKYAHENGCLWIRSRMCIFSMGHLDCVQYAFNNGCSIDNIDEEDEDKDEYFCDLAAEEGHLDCLRFGHENGAVWNEDTCEFAAANGHVDCLKYAHENGCPWDEQTCSDAAYNGELQCLQYAHEQGCPWEDDTVLNSIIQGHLECLKYAHQNGCDYDKEYFLRMANQVIQENQTSRVNEINQCIEYVTTNM